MKETSRLWDLVQNAQVIDPDDLESAIGEELSKGAIDYRTRLLIRDSSEVLLHRFGRSIPQVIGTFDPGESRGFPSLDRRVRQVTRPDSIRSFLRSLADSLSQEVEVIVGGSSSLILQDCSCGLRKNVDLVDEVPEALRKLHRELSTYKLRFGLVLAHFQSHFLPDGWRNRLRLDQDYRRLRVFLVDALDIYVGKMFSQRDKDRDDLHQLAASFDRQAVRHHMMSHGQKLLSEPLLQDAAQRNWFILHGEDLL